MGDDARKGVAIIMIVVGIIFVFAISWRSYADGREDGYFKGYESGHKDGYRAAEDDYSKAIDFYQHHYDEYQNAERRAR
jgi:hypothetical protein